MSNKLTLVLDSSQIASFLECPRLWNFGYRENLEKIPREGERDAARPMIMGTYAHKLLEIYYKVKHREGAMKAIEAAMAFNPDAICECGHEEKEHYQITVSKDSIAPLCSHNKCECKIGYKAVPFPLDNTDRLMVQKRFREYCYTYALNDYKPHDDSTVEVGFSYKLFESIDRLYVLEGKIDFLGTDASGATRLIMDHKSQLRSHDLYLKSIQFRNYALASDHRMLVVNYIRFTKEVTKDTFQRKIASFIKPELDWWEREVIKVYDRIAESMIREEMTENYWLSSSSEPNWASCSGRFGYACHFSPLCEEPHMAPFKKTSVYQIKKEWKPW